ncbi:hypothetical protein Vadar_007754 [Vaccinium darrowii]|uniref:Uncharacterized protein n=1 Tax=Vaccinium darrowii TaxID=229202 RepID=A0ACB7YK42_9ERIC|nr:hypothetical protein Vadar_007754 [Vaccinium darrowii]
MAVKSPWLSIFGQRERGFAAIDLGGREGSGSGTHFGVNVAPAPEELTRLYDSIFEKFDCDHGELIDLEEFRLEMKKIMLAISNGLGLAPV